jgi:2-keto-4-pentenoate hydratase/2-oxohepta-3-ene-1,7-dioic acid hydratase in catechol pathway
MRWLTYTDSSGNTRVGIVDGQNVHGTEPGLNMQGLVTAGPDALNDVATRLSTNPDHVALLSDVTVQLPIEPRSIRDSAGFIQHLRNVAASTGRVVDERFTQFPPFYFTNHAAAIGAYDDVRPPAATERLDFELEIAAIIGRGGSDISVDDAEDHIFGYTIFCDWSARDLQMNERDLFGPVKGKDFANTLGPVIVTADELEPLRSNRSFALRMQAYVNDEPVSDGMWDQIDWGFPDMVAYASRGTRLVPGDVLGSGTVPTGCLFEHFSLDPDDFRGWLQPGDEVRLVVDQLGETRQRVIDPTPVQRLTSGY